MQASGEIMPSFAEAREFILRAFDEPEKVRSFETDLEGLLKPDGDLKSRLGKLKETETKWANHLAYVRNYPLPHDDERASNFIKIDQMENRIKTIKRSLEADVTSMIEKIKNSEFLIKNIEELKENYTSFDLLYGICEFLGNNKQLIELEELKKKYEHSLSPLNDLQKEISSELRENTNQLNTLKNWLENDISLLSNRDGLKKAKKSAEDEYKKVDLLLRERHGITAKDVPYFQRMHDDVLGLIDMRLGETRVFFRRFDYDAQEIKKSIQKEIHAVSSLRSCLENIASEEEGFEKLKYIIQESAKFDESSYNRYFNHPALAELIKLYKAAVIGLKKGSIEKSSAMKKEWVTGISSAMSSILSYFPYKTVKEYDNKIRQEQERMDSFKKCLSMVGELYEDMVCAAINKTKSNRALLREIIELRTQEDRIKSGFVLLQENGLSKEVIGRLNKLPEEPASYLQSEVDSASEDFVKEYNQRHEALKAVHSSLYEQIKRKFLDEVKAIASGCNPKEKNLLENVAAVSKKWNELLSLKDKFSGYVFYEKIDMPLEKFEESLTRLRKEYLNRLSLDNSRTDSLIAKLEKNGLDEHIAKSIAAMPLAATECRENLLPEFSEEAEKYKQLQNSLKQKLESKISYQISAIREKCKYHKDLEKDIEGISNAEAGLTELIGTLKALNHERIDEANKMKEQLGYRKKEALEIRSAKSCLMSCLESVGRQKERLKELAGDISLRLVGAEGVARLKEAKDFIEKQEKVSYKKDEHGYLESLAGLYNEGLSMLRKSINECAIGIIDFEEGVVYDSKTDIQKMNDETGRLKFIDSAHKQKITEEVNSHRQRMNDAIGLYKALQEAGIKSTDQHIHDAEEIIHEGENILRVMEKRGMPERKEKTVEIIRLVPVSCSEEKPQLFSELASIECPHDDSLQVHKILHGEYDQEGIKRLERGDRYIKNMIDGKRFVENQEQRNYLFAVSSLIRAKYRDISQATSLASTIDNYLSVSQQAA